MLGREFENIEENDLFDIIINKYKEVSGFQDEPMDGDDVDSMAKELSGIYNWDDNEIRKFINYANIREGNTNPDDFDINLNEMKERDRMRRLTQSFEQKGEIFKEEREETNAEKLREEFKRLSALASGKETAALKESQDGNFMGGGEQGTRYNGSGQLKSVNSIVDNFYGNQNQYKGAQGNSIALRDNEGLEISIKRTLNSGAPISDISFYDEVNWNLAQLGFPSKLPQDIKTAILKMMS